MKDNLVKNTEKTFESIKYIDENGVEFWYARDLPTPRRSAKLLEEEKNNKLEEIK